VKGLYKKRGVARVAATSPKQWFTHSFCSNLDLEASCIFLSLGGCVCGTHELKWGEVPLNYMSNKRNAGGPLLVAIFVFFHQHNLLKLPVV